MYAQTAGQGLAGPGGGDGEVYLHQIISGRRRPSRDRVLCLCVAMGATLDEAQALLRQCGCAALYPKDRRDAIILYGLLHRHSLHQVNDLLFEHNEKTLS